MSFSFVDLFAGIGGFHAALHSLGGECLWASEIDNDAAAVYELNWQLKPAGDIVPLTDPIVDASIPQHEVLTAGFPCQPFSKSGKQQGFRDTTRGTLFFNICQILEARRPPLVLLENVRNLAGPRQRETWETIIHELRRLGYRVSSTPAVFSPHLLPPNLGGAPQVRERVFIVGVFVGTERALKEVADPPVVTPDPVSGFDPQNWDITKILQADYQIGDLEHFRLSKSEERWIDAWDDFVQVIRGDGTERLPGFPIWADHLRPRLPSGYKHLPDWKIDFLQKNKLFYLRHRKAIDAWFGRWENLEDFPPSRRKLEWQAQDSQSLWDCVLHFRPSGIRAKKATYLPALVAITQTSVIGPRRRRITPDEAKSLQGLPSSFSFGSQRFAASYKQLGNGVSVGAVTHVLRSAVAQYRLDLMSTAPGLVRAVEYSISQETMPVPFLATGS